MKMIAGAAALLLLCVVGCSNGSENVQVNDPFVYKDKPRCSTGNGLSPVMYIYGKYGIRLNSDKTADIQTTTTNSYCRRRIGRNCYHSNV